MNHLAENEVTEIVDIGDYIDVQCGMVTIGFTHDDFLLYAEAIAEAAEVLQSGQASIGLAAPLRVM